MTLKERNDELLKSSQDVLDNTRILIHWWEKAEGENRGRLFRMIQNNINTNLSLHGAMILPPLRRPVIKPKENWLDSFGNGRVHKKT